MIFMVKVNPVTREPFDMRTSYKEIGILDGVDTDSRCEWSS
jgi:hypothetical protein